MGLVKTAIVEYVRYTRYDAEVCVKILCEIILDLDRHAQVKTFELVFYIGGLIAYLIFSAQQNAGL